MRRCITSLVRDNERQGVLTEKMTTLERDRPDRGKLKIALHSLKKEEFRLDRKLST